MHHILLLAQASQPATANTLISTVAPFAIIFILFWFLLLRPQKKEQQRKETFRSNLRAGDEVVTSSGIFGKITSIDDHTAYIEIARSTKIRILKSQIEAFTAGVLPQEVSEATEETSEASS